MFGVSTITRLHVKTFLAANLKKKMRPTFDMPGHVVIGFSNMRMQKSCANVQVAQQTLATF